MSEKFKLKLDFNWKITVCVILLLPVLIKLSLWQLSRAEEKLVLAEQWKAQQSQPPVSFDQNEDYSPYQRVRLSGEYLQEKFWLQENQLLNGQLGYYVVMPFRLDSGTTLVVNRGWVMGSPHREYVPKIETPEGTIEISGTLITPSDSKLIREAEVRAKTWPHKILEIDIDVMEKQAALTLEPKVLNIDVDSHSALVVHWRPINMSPAKHYGYSVQWALMAIVLVILFVFASSNLGELFKRQDS